MYKLYTVTKNKTGILGLWKNENGKIFRDNIIIKNLNGKELYQEKKSLFCDGEQVVFYTDFENAIIESASGKLEILRHRITWQENKLRPSLVKALLVQHGGLTIFKNKNDFTLELWKE